LGELEKLRLVVLSLLEKDLEKYENRLRDEKEED